MSDFWKPEPREPWRDWRTWGMFVPLVISMLGFALTGIFAFAFSDIGVIRADVQSWLVIWGSALIVWGAEGNTPFTVIEVFRKVLRQEHNGWDISALVASLTGTAINLLVTFASRQVRFGDSIWRLLALSWGPLISGVAVTLDYYGGMIELGFLFGSHEVRYEQWLEERAIWQRSNGPVSWPVARVADYEAVCRGNGHEMTEGQLERALAERQLRMPSKSTVRRWLS